MAKAKDGGGRYEALAEGVLAATNAKLVFLIVAKGCYGSQYEVATESAEELFILVEKLREIAGEIEERLQGGKQNNSLGEG